MPNVSSAASLLCRAVADALGVATSHPTWLVERWLRQLGRHQTLALLRWNNA